MTNTLPASPPPRLPASVLAVEELHVAYTNRSGTAPALRGVSLQIAEGEAYGLVGESGCGKSTLAFAVMRYLGRAGQVTGGRILYQGNDLLTLSDGALRGIRGRRITMVYQDPGSSLNPSIVAGEQLAEVFRLQLKMDKDAAWTAAERMLGKVQVADAAAVMRRYPHQLSGGMQQRVVIAMALATDPDLIMDEPTTGLDVTVEAAVLDLVADLRHEFRSAILLISHNLGVIARVCDRVGVMYAGEIVEQGTAEEIFLTPRHPYTVGLLGSLPQLGQHRRPGDGTGAASRVRPIPGRMPSPRAMPLGCAFAPRCFMARAACDERHPPLETVSSTRISRCLFWQEVHTPDAEVTPRPVENSPVATLRAAGDAVPLLQMVDLRKEFRQTGSLSLLGDGGRTVKAVDGISLDLPRGSTLGIVGESGCGKSTLARCVAGLVEPTSGEIDFEGDPLPRKVESRSRTVRRRLQMVFQSPDATLNPSHTVGNTLTRSIRLLGGLHGSAARDRARALLRAVNLDERYLTRLPHQLSGGERQRVAIARALAGEPHLVICDEPLSALDVSVQAVVLNLLSDLQDREGISYLFISHDLSVVQYLADQVAVTYLGRIVDLGPAAAMATPPYHPYTEALLRAIPVPDPRQRTTRSGLPGSPPSAIDIPTGCPFHTRCPRKLGPICEEQVPPWFTTASGRRYACHIPPGELAMLQTNEEVFADAE